MKASKKLYTVKSNELVQAFRKKRTIWEQKCISYICAIIYENYTDSKPISEQEFSFKISDFRKACGAVKSGKTNAKIEDAIDVLEEKSSWVRIKREDGTQYTTTLAWLVKTRIENGVVYFRADEDLVPSIINLHTHYTKYETQNILLMNRGASICLYEYLKMHAFKKGWTVDACELIDILGYSDTAAYVSNKANFLNKVVIPAINEINELTDLDISIETRKVGNEIKDIEFSIKKSSAYIKKLKKDLPIT